MLSSMATAEHTDDLVVENISLRRLSSMFLLESLFVSF